MSSLSIDIALQRITRQGEEGFRAYVYDDRTGLRIRAPSGGHPTWLYGCNLDTEGSPELGMVVARIKLQGLDSLLIDRPWYMQAGDARQSVFLDISFNQGLHGLLDYPSMIHYASLNDWVNAAKQCSVNPDSLPGVIARYKHLSDILLSGMDIKYVP